MRAWRSAGRGPEPEQGGGPGARGRIAGALSLGAALATCLTAGLSIGPGAAQAAAGERVQVAGEIIDTWCYLSGVMGGPEAVTGSAHHTCALWCAAGGIPVGMLGDDGEVYMILKWAGSDDVAGGDTLLEIQSDRVVADGILHRRDGIAYIIVEQVVANEGTVTPSHEDYGVVPPFAIPEPQE